MTTPRPRMTLSLHHQVTAAVRAGGFAHIAAEAFGLPAAELQEAQQCGQTRRARGPWRLFALEFRQAIAQARLRAEMSVFADDPKSWLTHGPGRDRPDCRGWAVAVRPVAEAGAAVNALADPEFTHMVQSLRTELESAPGAYDQIASLSTWRQFLQAA